MLSKKQGPLAELFYRQTAKGETLEEQDFQQERLAVIAEYRQLIVLAAKTLRDRHAIDRLETIPLKKWWWNLWWKQPECVGLKLAYGVYLIPDHASLATITERDQYEEVDFAHYFDDRVTDRKSFAHHMQDFQPLALIKKKLESIIQS